ncbi:MAG: GNAT family N-acetyltransferase [Bacilli bacterium]|nr:GNAT family N-acetyltransferase [Bacilli bacterium]
MILDSIKNYLFDDAEDVKIINEIYSIVEHLNEDYPRYKEWFYNKQVNGCFSRFRDILFIKNENSKIIGVSFLKMEDNEKKICTLYVCEEYRKKGVGTMLLEESFNILGTKKPIITFNEDKLFMFEKIIVKYNWKLTKIVDSLYKDGIKEYCFNIV